ncbi:MAG: hypothetical protein WBF97_14845, partial [Comamonas sp.]
MPKAQSGMTRPTDWDFSKISGEGETPARSKPLRGAMPGFANHIEERRPQAGEALPWAEVEFERISKSPRRAEAARTSSMVKTRRRFPQIRFRQKFRFPHFRPPRVALPRMRVPQLSRLAMPSVSLPRIAVPRVSIPRVALLTVRLPRIALPEVPRISLPRISMPRVSITRMALPRVRLPRIALPVVPRISRPRISLPRISIPRVRLPRARMPRIARPTMPQISMPRLSAPRFAVPKVTMPRIALPRLPSPKPLSLISLKYWQALRQGVAGLRAPAIRGLRAGAFGFRVVAVAVIWLSAEFAYLVRLGYAHARLSLLRLAQEIRTPSADRLSGVDLWPVVRQAATIAFFIAVGYGAAVIVGPVLKDNDQRLAALSPAPATADAPIDQSEPIAEETQAVIVSLATAVPLPMPRIAHISMRMRNKEPAAPARAASMRADEQNEARRLMPASQTHGGGARYAPDLVSE